ETGTIVFEVDAGAAANALKVSSSSKVGLRTATPVLDIHMNTGDTPAVRFEQNASGGFTAQTWDIGANEANFFVRDVTGGSRLPFRVRPGAPTSSVDISATGNVGIGTTAADLKLSVSGDADKSVGGGSWQFYSDERRKNIKGRFNSGLKAVMQLQPIRFQYKPDNALGLQSEIEQVGFGAQ